MRKNICNADFLAEKVSNSIASYFSGPHNSKYLIPS